MIRALIPMKIDIYIYIHIYSYSSSTLFFKLAYVAPTLRVTTPLGPRTAPNSFWPIWHPGRVAYDASRKPPRPPTQKKPAECIIGHSRGGRFGHMPAPTCPNVSFSSLRSRRGPHKSSFHRELTSPSARFVPQ